MEKYSFGSGKSLETWGISFSYFVVTLLTVMAVTPVLITARMLQWWWWWWCACIQRCRYMMLSGAESFDVCIHLVSPPSAKLANWSRRQTGTASTVTQHPVGNDLSSRNTRGLLTFMLNCFFNRIFSDSACMYVSISQPCFCVFKKCFHWWSAAESIVFSLSVCVCVCIHVVAWSSVLARYLANCL